MRALGLLLLVIAGCGGYDPDLGDAPFRCGSQPAGACPEGYVCRDSICLKPGVRRECASARRPMTSPRDGGVDQSGFGYSCTAANCADRSNVENNCLDKDIESNDCPEAADDHDSFIGGKSLARFGTWEHFAICPPGDLDYIGFDAEANQSYRIVVSYDKRLGDLDLALVDPQNKVLAESQTSMGQEEIRFTATATARYYMAVFGATAALTSTYNFYLAPICPAANPICPAGYTCRSNGACELDASSVAPITLPHDPSTMCVASFAADVSR